jgi:hypothetical protein
MNLIESGISRKRDAGGKPLQAFPLHDCIAFHRFRLLLIAIPQPACRSGARRGSMAMAGSAPGHA